MVVSHLDPEHKSALSEILSRLSVMPVRESEEGMEVGANHVYVIPPNQDMVISGGILHLTPRTETRLPQMPVDTFLRSLARECGNDAVGVILSGTGTDGTLGLKDIREAGGLTFAQDDTARFSGMPRSAVAAGVVDFILPPAQIAEELLRITRQPLAGQVQDPPLPEQAAAQDVFLQILQLLSNATGVDFLHYKHSTLRRRIERRLVLLRLQTLGDYLECLRNEAGERRLLFEEVLIPVTSFFRDPDSYEALKAVILPRLLGHPPPGKPLRIWVAGCASGEEAYSIAMCLLEYLGTTPKDAPIKIFATDVSERAIETARNGAYGEAIATEVSAQRLQQFFLKTDRGYEIRKAVRDLCVFARHDLTRDPPFSQLDLVSCRNVLIYLDTVLQDRVLSVLHYALNPGGILMLGNSETVGRFTDLFEIVDRKHRFYLRTATPSRLVFEYTPGAATPPRVGVEGGWERDRGLGEILREADRVVLGRYAPCGVVVDESWQVAQFRGDTGPYLKPPPGPPTTELLLLAREGLLGDLRETLDRVRQDNVPAQGRRAGEDQRSL